MFTPLNSEGPFNRGGTIFGASDIYTATAADRPESNGLRIRSGKHRRLPRWCLPG